MPRLVSDYRLVSDKNRNGQAYWRVYIYDPKTKKTRKMATRIADDGSKRSRVEADRFALRLVQAGGTLEALAKAEITLDQLATDFWDWNRSTYLEARLARDQDCISPEYALNMASCYKNHIKSRLGKLPISEITPDVLDDLVTHLLGKRNLASSTVKHVIHSISPVFKWAVRKRLIQYNPIPSMLEFSVRAKTRRDAFQLEEAQRLLSLADIGEVWGAKTVLTASGEIAKYNSNFLPWRNYALSLLAAVTGARIGSILPLRREHISLHKHAGQEFYIVTLRFSVSSIRGIKPGSKTDVGTEVPVAKEVLEPILRHLPESGFLFPSRGKHGVLTGKSALRALKQAMVRVGIDDGEQSRRNLGFHAWRHTWVTRARAVGLSEAVRSSFTEHKDERTAAGYTHLKALDLLEALPMQRAFMVG